MSHLFPEHQAPERGEGRRRNRQVHPDATAETEYAGPEAYAEHQVYDEHAAYDEHAEHAAYDEHAVYEDEPVYIEESAPSRRSRRVSKRVKRRRRTLAFLVVLALFAGVVFFVVQAVTPMLAGPSATDYPGPGHGSVSFVVPEGATGRTVATALTEQGVVGSDVAFLNALAAANASGSLQPGTFTMKLEMKAADAVTLLTAAGGDKVHYAAIDQNLRQSDVLPLLAKATGIDVTAFTALAATPATFGLPAEAKSLEGYLAPGEYRFPIEMTAQEILAQLVKTTTDELVSAGVTAPAEQYRVLTVASIIEAEGNADNYAMISGAIENRLNKANAETGGRLESDATVAYGLGIKTYNISDAQKADKSNPYNTFANPGLPAGPIGSPKMAAITAGAHPQANPYYFWVTVDLDTGETLYATTFAEHLKNVAKYTAWCTAHEGKCT
ncbi:endolytic transglycosylase MltG [Arthrobacter sp. 35W]|uniref:endolytic transglycosylase MltG n=1 Tax=Arthrobacter sp. 35W TaxID=1132441 RepID=UPI0004227FFE|nr:endolytic transglycosylase MltG [Arthrobacter sp. 35W]